MLTSSAGYLPLSLGVVYTDKLFVNNVELLSSASGQIIYNDDGVLGSSVDLTYDSDTGTLQTAYISSAEETLAYTNSTESGNIVVDCAKGSDIQIVGGALAANQGASMSLLPTSSGYGGAVRIMAGPGTDRVFSMTPSDYSTPGGVLLLLPGATASGNAVCHMLGTTAGALTISGGSASGTAAEGGWVFLWSTHGSVSLTAGALAPTNTSQQGSIYIVAPNSGTAIAGSVKIASNGITYIWPSVASAAAANGSIMLVTTSAPPVATLSFVPVSGDATISASGVLAIGSTKVLTQHFATNSVDSTKFASKAVTTVKLATTGVSAGSYTRTSLTVDAQGRMTAISSGVGRGYIQCSTSADANYTVAGTNILAFNSVYMSSSGFSLSSGIVTVPVNKTVLIAVNIRASAPAWAVWYLVDGSTGTAITGNHGIQSHSNNRADLESANTISHTIFTTSSGNITFKMRLHAANGTDTVSVKQGSSICVIEI